MINKNKSKFQICSSRAMVLRPSSWIYVFEANLFALKSREFCDRIRINGCPGWLAIAVFLSWFPRSWTNFMLGWRRQKYWGPWFVIQLVEKEDLKWPLASLTIPLKHAWSVPFIWSSCDNISKKYFGFDNFRGIIFERTWRKISSVSEFEGLQKIWTPTAWKNSVWYMGGVDVLNSSLLSGWPHDLTLRPSELDLAKKDQQSIKVLGNYYRFAFNKL